MKHFYKVLIISVLCLLTACTQQTEQSPTPLINDYYGSVTRIVSVKEDVETAISNRLLQSGATQLANPTDYWGQTDFVDVSREMLDLEDLNLIGYLNEGETTWENAVELIQDAFIGKDSTLSRNSIQVVRNTAHDYMVTAKEYGETAWAELSSCYRYYNVLYDPNRDWSQLLVQTFFPSVGHNCTEKIFEYARTDDGYIIQTETERLITHYRDGNLKSFVYTKLDGRCLNGYEDDGIPYTADGEIKNQYNTKDTIFTHMSDITDLWAYEYAGNIDTYITYDDQTMSVGFWNKLMATQEEYIIDAEGRVR